MLNVSSRFLKECMSVLKSEEVRGEIKQVFSPVTEAILCEIYPFICLIVGVIVLMFAMLAALLFMVIITFYYKQ